MTKNDEHCRIAVVGCGALGQFYAAQLSHAGHDLRLLARRDAARLEQRGIVVQQSPTEKVRSSLEWPRLHIEPQRLIVATEPRQLVVDAYPDWVLVAIKTTALDQAEALVATLLGEHTNVVVMCNGLGVEDRFAEWFGSERIFGLLCFVGVHREEDGLLRHLAFGHVAAGHFLDDAAARDRLRRLFEQAGIMCECPPSLLEARWRKLVWNVPFNGLCVLYDSGTNAIVQNPERRAFASAIAREIVTLGNLDLKQHGLETQIEGEWANLQLERTDTMDDYAPSTLLDARAGRALEIDMMFLEPARRARRLGAESPALDRLIQGLRERGFVN
ncbi:MAG TPA: 2-dehydropantoate 2-reductase [Polyangiaceae bacterium]